MKPWRPSTVTRFDARSKDYAQYRPSYPAEVIDAVFAGLEKPERLFVVDVGAGTGISARLLAERGARVLGIEPNAEMRAVACASGLDVRDGRADALELPGESVDLVTCFQAFHWFANALSVAEFVRVLRPGGRVAVVFNERDDNDSFTRGFGEIVDGFTDRMALAGYRNGSQVVLDLLSSPGLNGVRLRSFSNSQRLDYEGLLGRVRSTSYAPREGPAHATMIETLRALFDVHAREGTIDMVYRTDVFLADRT